MCRASPLPYRPDTFSPSTSLGSFIARSDGPLDRLLERASGSDNRGYDASFDGLIADITLTRVRILIAEGPPPFGDLPKDIELEHISTRNFPSGLVTSEYHVKWRRSGGRVAETGRFGHSGRVFQRQRML